jgi:hypothetical protein
LELPRFAFDDTTVYMRTAGGQREAVFGSRVLSKDQRRLLLMINGYTPLRTLVDLCPEVADMIAAIGHLVESDLIAPVVAEESVLPREP